LEGVSTINREEMIAELPEPPKTLKGGLNQEQQIDLKDDSARTPVESPGNSSKSVSIVPGESGKWRKFVKSVHCTIV